MRNKKPRQLKVKTDYEKLKEKCDQLERQVTAQGEEIFRLKTRKNAEVDAFHKAFAGLANILRNFNVSEEIEELESQLERNTTFGETVQPLDSDNPDIEKLEALADEGGMIRCKCGGMNGPIKNFYNGRKTCWKCVESLLESAQILQEPHTTVRCTDSACNVLNASWRKICRTCRKPLPKKDDELPEGYVQCSYCGNPQPAHSGECRSCNRTLDESTPF